jgi:parallel beta-helix repeat protein
MHNRHIRSVALLTGLVSLQFGFAATASAATAEVTQSGSNYIVRVDGVQTLSTTSYLAALQNAAGTGNRVMNIRAAGSWNGEVRLRATSSFNYLTSTYSNIAGATALYSYKSSGIQINGAKLSGTPGIAVRLSSCASPRFTNCDIDARNGSISVVYRIDSEGSTRTSGLYARNINSRNTASGGDRQGFETYSIDGYDISDMKGSSVAGCGVLINDGRSGTIGSTNTNTCGKGTTYAGLRWANNCDGATTSSATDASSARGIFILNSTRVTINNANVSNNPVDSIWIQNGSNNRVLAGTARGPKRPVITTSPGSSINVTYTP